MKPFLGFVTIVVFATTLSIRTQSVGPTETVRAFYTFSNARSSTFNRRHISVRRSWYTPALYQAFLNQAREDEAHLKNNPTDKPYFGDGLTFRPLDEPRQTGERTYKRIQRVGRTVITGNTTDVAVTFAYPEGCTEALAPIIYHVRLQKIGGRWLIDDWVYEDSSTLVDDMNEQTYNRDRGAR